MSQLMKKNRHDSDPAIIAPSFAQNPTQYQEKDLLVWAIIRVKHFFIVLIFTSVKKKKKVTPDAHMWLC